MASDNAEWVAFGYHLGRQYDVADPFVSFTTYWEAVQVARLGDERLNATFFESLRKVYDGMCTRLVEANSSRWF